MKRWLRRFLIARAIRAIIVPYRMGKAQQLHDTAIGNVAPESRYGWTELTGGWFSNAATPAAKVKREPGRQQIRMGGSSSGAYSALSSVFGNTPEFELIPENARATRWEDCHDFGRHVAKPVRDPTYGLQTKEPPLTLDCMECGLKQPPLNSGKRDCPYCGLRMKLHGSLIYHWRDDPEPAISWGADK